MDAATILLLVAALAAAATLGLAVAARRLRRMDSAPGHQAVVRPAGPGAEGMNPVERGRIAPGPRGGDRR